MKDLREFISGFLADSESSVTADELIEFLNDNRWFGHRPQMKGNAVCISPEQEELYTQALQVYIGGSGDTSHSLEQLTHKYPRTELHFKAFIRKALLDDTSVFYIASFLSAILEKELILYTDREIEQLLVCATNDLTKENGDALTFFLSYLRARTRTSFHKDYIMQKRYTMDLQNSAYSFDEYLELAYKMFSTDYIDENDMYQQAADSMNYTDTWLYLSLHFICSLRTTDLERIYHPVLPYPAKDVLEKIREDTFTLKDSLSVLNSITQKMCWLPFTPKKTGRHSGVEHVRLHFPSSCEEHFGKLFALAEAHRQISGLAEEPIIRRITTYKQINSYMGEDIGHLFLERDFGSRSATKSYLQALCMASVDGEEGLPNTKGYIIASLARSHKGSYGEFAATTFEYLKDANFNGFTPEFVAFELMERGVLSFITSEMLDMVTDGKFKALGVKQQTDLLKETGLSAGETESVVSTALSARRFARESITALVTGNDNLLEILHRIGNGQAFSKQAGTMCVLSSIRQVCPFPERRQCLGCRYEILTKSAMMHITSEYKRMRHLYRSVSDDTEKEKYAYLVKTVLLPKLQETLECLRKDYGQEIYDQYSEYIKEYLAC